LEDYTDRFLLQEPPAREKGLYRMKGKEYVVKDGDVIPLNFNV
jgi:ribosome-binding ATPase YchF (GTP1/OBG family)